MHSNTTLLCSVQSGFVNLRALSENFLHAFMLMLFLRKLFHKKTIFQEAKI